MEIRIRKRPSNPVRESFRVLGLYIRGQSLIFLWEIFLYSIGFALTGVPLWGLMSFFCAVLGWVPHIGSILGIGLVIVAGAIGGLNLVHLGLTVGVWAVTQGLEAFWLGPRVLGRPLGLKPWVVFLAVLVGSLAFGPLGLFLAVPALAITMVWVRYFKRPKHLRISHLPK